MEGLLRRTLMENFAIELVHAGGLWPALVDPARLESAVLNLCLNARDAMPNGGRLTLETKNVVLDDAYANSQIGVAAGPYAMLAVSDTGIGMSPEVLAHLFEPFFTTKERGKGTGLGLATLFGIVRQSGGAIAVDTAPGRGTTFRVYLPRAAGPAAAAGDARDDAGAARGSETLLLVEDEARVRTFMRRSLEAAGYRVLEAAGPREAHAAAGAHAGSIDLLVSDVVLPDARGPELAAQLRAARPGLRVLFVSGYTDDARLRSGALEPWQAFLQKPFTHAQLARAVRAALDGAALAAEAPVAGAAPMR